MTNHPSIPHKNRPVSDTYTVEKEAQLLDWLLSHLSGLSRNKIKDILRGRGIKVNGKTVTKHDFRLSPGMTVSVSRSKEPPQLKSRFVSMVYEDAHIMVIEKQAGILSMAAGHGSLNVKTVLDQYLDSRRERCRAHVVHRLDRDTSGLMVYAKSREVEQLFEASWHDMVYDRRYVAVLSGEVIQDNGTIESYLKDNAAYFTYSSPTPNGGKYAVSHFQVLRRTPHHTLTEFKLETGRKNQIRVHAADMGHPVCGDPKYGNGDDPIGRLCLHAYLLCFFHPITGRRMEFETDIPNTFKSLF